MEIAKLRKILIANGMSCIFFGLLFALAKDTVGPFFNASNLYNDWFMWIGAGLTLNGFYLFFTARKSNLKKMDVRAFAIGDFIWVLATIDLIFFHIGITTKAGIMVSLAIAAMVFYFGWEQWRLSAELS